MTAFPTTQWQLVDRLKVGGQEGLDALGELASIYGPPVMAYARGKFPGRAREEYEDMVQGFLLSCFKDQSPSVDDTEVVFSTKLAGAAPERGKFRNFLVTCFKRYVLNLDRAAVACKRCPGEVPQSLEAALQEHGQAAEPRDDETPDAAFDRVYFAVMLGRAVKLVSEEWLRHDQKVKLELFLRRSRDLADFSVLATELRLGSPGNARALYRAARNQLRNVLRGILAGGCTDRIAKAEADYILATAVSE